MKKLVLGSLLLSTICIYSCNKDSNVNPSEQRASKHDEFSVLLNEKVRIPSGVDPKALAVSNPNEAGNYVLNSLSSSGGRTKDLKTLDPSSLHSIMLEINSKYPAFDFSLEKMPDEHLIRIQKDFPDIKNQEDAYNKREAIALYYENLQRYEFIEKIKSTNIPTTASGRTKYFNRNLPGGWGWLAAVYYTASAFGYHAESQIVSEASVRFGCDPNANDGDHINAFKHSGWCGLIARKLIASGKSKMNGTGEAGIITSSYECESVNFDPSMPNSIFMVYNKKLPNAMDLWNNSIGRSYIYHNTTFGAFGVRTSFPSEGYFLDQMQTRLCTHHAEFKFYNALVPSLPYSPDYDVYPVLVGVQPDAEAAWTTLYRHTYSDWHNFVTIKTGCQCY